MPSGVRSLLAALRTRYGRGAALVIAFAAVALVVVPVPGIVFAPVGVAELLLRVKPRRTAAAASVKVKT